MSKLVVRCGSLPVEKGERQDVVSDTQGGPTAEAGYSSDYAEVEFSRREQSRENAALCFGAHQGFLIIGDGLSCHAVPEARVGEHVRTV